MIFKGGNNVMKNMEYLQWKYARNYEIAHKKCHNCKTDLEYLVKTITIGKQTIENARVLACQKCSNLNNEL
jgi:DNA-directed RNA polymerase subunit RPC12/RpoP